MTINENCILAEILAVLGTEIFKLIKIHRINEHFVYRTIIRLGDTGGINDHQRSGRPPIARTKNRIKLIREKIFRILKEALEIRRKKKLC